jgi:hypothetical protein
VLAAADEVLLPHCENYRIGSLTGIEILPGESDQALHPDDGIYPLKLSGMQLQIDAMWALDDFTVENGATRVVLGSHKDSVRSGYAKPGAADNDRLAQAVMPAGSVLLYLGNTLHGGGRLMLLDGLVLAGEFRLHHAGNCAGAQGCTHQAGECRIGGCTGEGEYVGGD